MPMQTKCSIRPDSELAINWLLHDTSDWSRSTKQTGFNMDSKTAHITSQGCGIHAMLSTGEMFIGTLDEITALLRSRSIGAEGITMPNKDDEDSPSTGQRIAIYHALHGDKPYEIEPIRKRQEASDFGIASVRLSGFVLDAWALEQHRLFVAGEISSEQMRENALARYRQPKPADD